jgi:hypothetical protein
MKLMEGYGFAYLFSLLIFFVESALGAYCFFKTLQLVGVNLPGDRSVRISCIILVATPLTCYLSAKFFFADAVHFYSLLILFTLAVVLKLLSFNQQRKSNMNE